MQIPSTLRLRGTLGNEIAISLCFIQLVNVVLDVPGLRSMISDVHPFLSHAHGATLLVTWISAGTFLPGSLRSVHSS